MRRNKNCPRPVPLPVWKAKRVNTQIMVHMLGSWACVEKFTNSNLCALSFGFNFLHTDREINAVLSLDPDSYGSF